MPMPDHEQVNIPLEDIQLDALERIVDSIIDHAVDNEVAETIGIGTKRVITELRATRADNARLQKQVAAAVQIVEFVRREGMYWPDLQQRLDELLTQHDANTEQAASDATD